MSQPKFGSLSFAAFGLMLCVFGGSPRVSAAIQADDLRERIEDKNGIRTDVWVYNNIGDAIQQAKSENKPIFVTFRCVPCKACAAFDADVANGNQKVRELAKEKFVSVRQVEMKDVDLSLFEFDHDLNWAAMFINADGTIYARYGTQSAEGPDAYNSIDGLVNDHESSPGTARQLPQQPGRTDWQTGGQTQRYDGAGIAWNEECRKTGATDHAAELHPLPHDS